VLLIGQWIGGTPLGTDECAKCDEQCRPDPRRPASAKKCAEIVQKNLLVAFESQGAGQAPEALSAPEGCLR
jgi:hypothetical protein